jgi:hypothetical protein
MFSKNFFGLIASARALVCEVAERIFVRSSSAGGGRREVARSQGSWRGRSGRGEGAEVAGVVERSQWSWRGCSEVAGVVER